jgi:hypothetical protein
MVLLTELTRRPFSVPKSYARGPRHGGSADCALVHVSFRTNGSITVSITFPVAFVAGAFRERQTVDLAVMEEDAKLRWVLCRPGPIGAYPRLRTSGSNYRWEKTSDAVRLTAIMGRFPVSSLQVCAQMRLEDIEGQPGEKAVVLEIEEALQEFFSQTEQPVLEAPAVQGQAVNEQALGLDADLSSVTDMVAQVGNPGAE